MAVALLGCAWPAAADSIKCWTNREGVRECGNAVPPEYAQQRTEIINERGIVLDVRERAKTPEELAEERRLARQQAEAQRRAEAQAREDHILLSTFTTERDILISRDNKLAAIDGTIAITRSNVSALEQNLAALQRRAADLERAGRTPPEDLLAEMAEVRRQIADKERFIARKHEEQAELRKLYAQYLQRFREIKAAEN